jgi:hypothetical protein
VEVLQEQHRVLPQVLHLTRMLSMLILKRLMIRSNYEIKYS